MTMQWGGGLNVVTFPLYKHDRMDTLFQTLSVQHIKVCLKKFRKSETLPLNWFFVSFLELKQLKELLEKWHVKQSKLIKIDKIL